MGYFGRMNEVLKLTANTYPEYYLCLFYGVLATGIGVYRWLEAKKTHHNLPRYRFSYTVLRPNDERLQLFPKSYVTERHLLAKDHPETIDERKYSKLPPLKDPYVVNKWLRKE